MSTTLSPGTQDRVATLLGYALFATFFVLFFNIINLPRTPIELRAPYQHFHDSLGLVVTLLAWARIYWFIKGPAPVAPEGLPADSFAASRSVLFAIVLTFAIIGTLGIFFAWAEHHRSIRLFGLWIPDLMPENDGIRQFAGYTRSALAFYYLMLFVIWLVYGTYQNVRYKVGMRRLFPGQLV